MLLIWGRKIGESSKQVQLVHEQDTRLSGKEMGV